MKRGFTLIELMITITIIATIAMISTAVYRTGIRAYPENFEKANIQTSLNFLTDSIADYTKKASNTLQTYDGKNRNNNTVKSILILQIPAITQSDQAEPNKFVYTGATLEKDTVVYYLENGNLYKRYYGNAGGEMHAQDGTPRIVLKNVSNFSCDYLNLVGSEYSTISCTVTVSKNIFGKNYTVTTLKKANLRNVQ